MGPHTLGVQIAQESQEQTMKSILDNTTKFGATLAVTLVVLVSGVSLSLLSALGQIA